MKRVAVLSLALFAHEATASPARLESAIWHCPVTESVRCESGRPCVAGSTNVIIVVDPGASRFARCWNNLDDCDYFQARFWLRGEQLTGQSQQDGNLVNLSPDLAVTEVSTIGHAVFVFRGRCSAAAGVAQTPGGR